MPRAKSRTQPKGASNVVPISKHQHDDTIDVLEKLLVHAKAGNITGLAIAWRTRSGKHSGSTTGLYATDYIAALGAASKLWSQINNAHDDMLDE